MRNRLVGRSKYLIPTGSNGFILQTSEKFEKEIKKAEAKRLNEKIVLRYSEFHRLKKEKRLFLPSFTISNMFHNNVLITKV